MNSAILYGTLIETPQLRYTSDQKPVCSSYIQFTERTKDAAKSTLKATAFGKVADALHSVPQGATVILEGSLRMNKVSTDQGNRTVPEFSISRLEVINSQPKVPLVSQKTVDVDVSELDTEIDDEDDPCPI
jgi:single-stranded DNA-binding protein